MRDDNKISKCCLMALGAWVAWIGGCHKDTLDRVYQNPYDQPRTIAVTIFSNQSGSTNFDTMAMTDEFYAELQLIDQFHVIPVNRVLAAMNAMRLNAVSSPTEAMDLADALNADMVIVGAVTRYDPYFKPSIGMVLQLYDRVRLVQRQLPDIGPEDFKQQAKPFFTEPQVNELPETTIVRIIDCDQDEVIDRLEAYADSRTGKKRPDGWKYYTRGRNFLRFASYEMIGELLAKEKQRMELLKMQTQQSSVDNPVSGDSD